MPIIWTHIQFSEDVVDSIQKTDDYSQYERYMKFGTQNTNLNYFINLWRNKRKGVNKTVNDTKSFDFTLELIKKAKNKPKHVQAYVFGVMTHYILEQKIRPYIEYLNDKVNCHYISVEAQIDTLIMKRKYNLKTWKTPVYNEINIGLFIDKHIMKLLSEINYPIANNIQRNYLFLNIALRYYFDPYGWKTKLLPSFQPLYTPYYHSQSGIDYLNEYHNTWFNNVTNETSTSNFNELYDEAKLEATVILNEIVKYWSNPHNELNNDIKQLLYSINKQIPTTRSS